MTLDIKDRIDDFNEEHGRKISLGAILFVVLISAIIFFTYIDITVHDFYALPLGSMCYTGNTNPYCVPVEKMHNCPTGGDACIEARYYQMLSVEAFYLSGLLVFLKMAISQGILRFHFNGTRAFQTFVWGASPLILLWTGWEDFLYYVTRGMGIPSPMPWLNSTGIFPYVTQYVTHDTDVGPLDMAIVMAIGVAGVGILLYLYSRLTDEEDYKIPI